LVGATLPVTRCGHVEAVAFRLNSGKLDEVKRSTFGTGQFHATDLDGAILALTLDEQPRVVGSEVYRTITQLELRNRLQWAAVGQREDCKT